MNHTMYRQLQQKVKEYIVGYISQVSDEFRFDIDMADPENPIIVGYGPNDLIIRGPVDKFNWNTTQEMMDKIATLCRLHHRDIDRWAGCIMIRRLFSKVFEIYGIDIYQPPMHSANILIIGIDGIKKISSWIFCDYSGDRSISPFMSETYMKYSMPKEVVSPILLLLDPITYFRKYSDIIKKYQVVDDGYTLGIYELLLEYFPEMNGELVDRYLLLGRVDVDWYYDILFCVGRILIDLYRGE